MASEVIQVGNKIELRSADKWIKSMEAADTEVYVSQFLQWLENDVAQIAVPTFQSHFVPLHRGDVYELRFFTRSGLYRCQAKILKSGKTSNMAVAEVKVVSALEKYQRRQYYRMNCIIPLDYAVISEEQKTLYREKKRCLTLEQKLQVEKKLENQEIEFRKATVLDISGGGVRFNSSEAQEAGEILLLQPDLPETVRKRVPFLFGRVISCHKIPNKEPVVYDNRIEFVEINHAEQEQIITYIFKEERSKRKRENKEA